MCLLCLVSVIWGYFRSSLTLTRTVCGLSTHLWWGNSPWSRAARCKFPHRKVASETMPPKHSRYSWQVWRAVDRNAAVSRGPSNVARSVPDRNHRKSDPGRFGCLISQLKTIHQGVMDVVKERYWDSNILGILTAAHPEKSKATCRNHHRVLEQYAFVA